MQQEFLLETPEHVGALAHPLRLQILTLLADTPRTNQQIAELLGESPARLHFHVRELARAGLIHMVEQRPKGGVIEKYYLAAARGYRLAPALVSGAGAEQDVALNAWDSARQDLVEAIDAYEGPPPWLRVLHHQEWLTAEAVLRVLEHLDAIDAEFQTARSERIGEQNGTVNGSVPDRRLVGFASLMHRMPADDVGPADT
jgi:DNA-binding transcriptional ArsR family regulator